MKKKTEKTYFNEQWEAMVGQLSAFMETGDQEKLHLFRVQVKKLRAMLTLLDAASPKHKLSKGFKPVRKIFKHCGNIRNAHINLQLGIRYHLDNERFINSQQAEIENGTNEIQQLRKKYLKTITAVYKELKDNLKAIDNEQITEFYKFNIEQIAITLDSLQFDEGLHDCRKRIKILLYNRKIAHDALTGTLVVDNRYLDKLQEHIGNWHDNILAMDLFSSPEINEKLVVAKIKRQNTALKKSITILAKDFWKKAMLYSNTSDKIQEEKWVLR